MYKQRKIVAVTVLVLLTILSITVLSPKLSSPEFHAETIQVLEGQKAKALALGATVTIASTGLTMLPDDTATTIAQELADLSLPLFLIVSFIYLEIFLLTTFGWITCTFLIPAICVTLIGYVFFQESALLAFARKLGILALALLLVIPAGAKMTTQVENTFKETIEQKYYAAEHVDDENNSSEKEGTNAIAAFFSGMADNVTGMIEAGKNKLSTMIDAVAVLVITSVMIPLLTLLLFMRVIKMLTDGHIPTEYVERMLAPKIVKKKIEELKQEQANERISA